MKGILWLTIPSQSLPVDAIYKPAKHLHVTLQFDTEFDRWKKLIGKTVNVELIANCWNDEIQAIRVKLPSYYKRICQNKEPHITVSHLENVAPFKSNEMLNSDHEETLINQRIQAVVEFFEFKQKKSEDKPQSKSDEDDLPKNAKTELKYKLGKSVVEQLSPKQIQTLFEFYDSLEPQKKAAIDIAIFKDEPNELMDMALQMIEETKKLKESAKKISAENLRSPVTSELFRRSFDVSGISSFVDVGVRRDSQKSLYLDPWVEPIDTESFKRAFNTSENPFQSGVRENPLPDPWNEERSSSSTPDITPSEDPISLENIDERILRILGEKEPYSAEFNYDNYIDLLKKKLVEARETRSTISGEDSDLLLEEWKRIRGKKGKGKFVVKKISSEDIRRGSAIVLQPQERQEEFSRRGEETSNILFRREGRGSNQIIEEIQNTLLEIINLLRSQNLFERTRQERERRYVEIQLRRRRERRLETRPDNVLSKVVSNALTPIKSILEKIKDFIITVFLGRALIKLIRWLSDKNNKEKVSAIFKFIGDHWPKLLALYILFGTRLGKFARGLTHIVIKGTKFLVRAAAEFLGKRGLSKIGKLGKFLGGPKGRAIANVIQLGTTIAGTMYLTKQIEDFSGLGGKSETTTTTPVVKHSGGGMASSSNLFSLLTNRSGKVKGPKGIDQVPAMLTDGEFVMSRGAVQKYGVDTLEAMNAAGGGTNRPKITEVAGFPLHKAAGGGMIGKPPPAPKLSPLEIQFANRARKYGITDPLELKAFLAQIYHETGGNLGKPVREKYNTDPRDPPGKPGYYYFNEVLGYGSMNGNRNNDDGYRYSGRGYIMLTGRDNYAEFGKAIGRDLINHPELLVTNPEISLAASVAYWKKRVRPKIKKWDDVFSVSREINNPSATSPSQIYHMEERNRIFRRYNSIPNKEFLNLLSPPTPKPKREPSLIENVGQFLRRFIPGPNPRNNRASIDLGSPTSRQSSDLIPQDLISPGFSQITPSSSPRYNIPPPASGSRVQVIQVSDNASVPRMQTAASGTPRLPTFNAFPTFSPNHNRNASIMGVG